MFLLFTIYLIVYCKKGVCHTLRQPLFCGKAPTEKRIMEKGNILLTFCQNDILNPVK